MYLKARHCDRNVRCEALRYISARVVCSPSIVFPTYSVLCLYGLVHTASYDQFLTSSALILHHQATYNTPYFPSLTNPAEVREGHPVCHSVDCLRLYQVHLECSTPQFVDPLRFSIVGSTVWCKWQAFISAASLLVWHAGGQSGHNDRLSENMSHQFGSSAGTNDELLSCCYQNHTATLQNRSSSSDLFRAVVLAFSISNMQDGFSESMRHRCDVFSSKSIM
jgi:hypothetical protein